jgi:hypothetical protein
MTKLDLDADNVQEETLTVTEIRADDEVALVDKVSGWLDNAQGQVFTEKHKEFYLVIKVTA